RFNLVRVRVSEKRRKPVNEPRLIRLDQFHHPSIHRCSTSFGNVHAEMGNEDPLTINLAAPVNSVGASVDVCFGRTLSVRGPRRAGAMRQIAVDGGTRRTRQGTKSLRSSPLRGGGSREAGSKPIE